jgi:tRNA-(ms[2]io[6]A)-hydroxylase
MEPSSVIRLRHHTPAEWVGIVEGDVTAFLQDHAANERKVSQSALNLAVQHPARTDMVAALIDIAREELEHFKRVFDLLVARGDRLAFDVADPYMGAVHRAVKRPHVDDYLLDRLVMFGIVEARGHERFALLSEGLGDPELRRVYASFMNAEARHHGVYLDLARGAFDSDRVDERLDALLDVEAEIARSRPLRPSLF